MLSKSPLPSTRAVPALAAASAMIVEAECPTEHEQPQLLSGSEVCIKEERKEEEELPCDTEAGREADSSYTEKKPSIAIVDTDGNEDEGNKEEGRPALAATGEAATALTTAPPTTVKCEASIGAEPHQETQLGMSNFNSFVSLWASATTGITVGTTVFAPQRAVHKKKKKKSFSSSSTGGCAADSRRTLLHYSLAEVTGLQSSAGTATVSFLFTEPGVDDEAFSLYDLIPCPLSWLTELVKDARDGAQEQSGSTQQRSMCSLLERVMGVSLTAGPVNPSRAYGAMLAGNDEERGHVLRSLFCISDDDEEAPLGGTVHGNPTQNAASSPLSSSPASGTASSGTCSAGTAITAAKIEAAEATLENGGTHLTFSYIPPASVHAFYARAFRTIDRAVESRRALAVKARQHRYRKDKRMMTAVIGGVGAPAPPPVVLCVFDSYGMLRRFEVFMSLRGHIVRLLDGSNSNGDSLNVAEDSSSAEREEDDKEEVDGDAPASKCQRVDNSGKSQQRQKKNKMKRQSEPAVCQGIAPLPAAVYAFSSACKVWLCALRDDVSDVGLDGLTALLRPAPPVDFLVSLCERDEDAGEGKGTITSGQPAATTDVVPKEEEAIRQLLRLTLDTEQYICSTFRDLPEDPTVEKVKVSGGIFHDNKVLVPASREQLLLMETVLAPSVATAAAATAAQSGASSSLGTASARLSPALLERIALGNFTDASAAQLFQSYNGTVLVHEEATTTTTATSTTAAAAARSRTGAAAATTTMSQVSSIQELQHKFYQDASYFGDAFPVFAAAAAIIRDVFANPGSFLVHSRPVASRPSRSRRAVKRERRDEEAAGEDSEEDSTWEEEEEEEEQKGGDIVGGFPFSPSCAPWPRIVLVFPRGNPGGNPNLAVNQFLHNLQQYFAPWWLYEMELPSDAAAELPVSVLWHRRGGILLLYCDEPGAQLGALHTEADVVIACGKHAAAWVAANTVEKEDEGVGGCSGKKKSSQWHGPVHFAVLSEVEVVPSALAHAWVPFTATAHAPTGAAAHGALAAAVVAAESERLWRHLLQYVAQKQRQQQKLPKAGGSGAKEEIPRVLQQAITLWNHLKGHNKSTGGSSDGGSNVTAAADSWAYLSGFVRSMALNCATSTPLRILEDLQIKKVDGPFCTSVP